MPPIYDGRWTMDDGRWTMDDVGNSRAARVYAEQMRSGIFGTR